MVLLSKDVEKILNKSLEHDNNAVQPMLNGTRRTSLSNSCNCPKFDAKLRSEIDLRKSM